jgi:hypothetical protein
MNAKQRIGIGVVVRAVSAAHEAPVRIEFLGKNHRQCGVNALPKFQPVDGHRDLAVAGDLHEGGGLLCRLEIGGHLAATGRLAHRDVRKCAQRQPGCPGQLQEAAAWQHRGSGVRLPFQQALQGARQFAVVDVM